MKKRPLLGSVLVLALALGLGAGSFQPAAAGDWHIGAGFRVGKVHFSVAYNDHYRHRYRAAPYYRTKHRLHYDGYRCGSYCLKRSGYYYHHAGCPLVLQHFRVHRYSPTHYWGYDRSPYGYKYRGHGHYKHRGYYPYPGYERGYHPDYHGSRYHRHSDSCRYR